MNGIPYTATYANSQSITSTGEWSMPNDAAYATTGVNNPGTFNISILMPTAAVAADVFRAKGYVQINGGALVEAYRVDLAGGNAAEQAYIVPSITSGELWDVTLQNISGSARTLSWSISTPNTVQTNAIQWAGFTTATTQNAIATGGGGTGATDVNVIGWAGFVTATYQLAVATTVTSATNVNVVGWAGFAVATTQVAVATSPLSVNTTQWAGFNTATTQLAVATTAGTSATNVNVVSWAGAATATTQIALATLAPANAIQWAGAATATTQQALATFVNVNQWAGAPTATTQLAVATGVTANLASTALSSIWGYAIETGATAEESLRLANSANGAILAGATTANLTIRDLANTKNRVDATVDGVGNRTAVTRDLT